MEAIFSLASEKTGVTGFSSPTDINIVRNENGVELEFWSQQYVLPSLCEGTFLKYLRLKFIFESIEAVSCIPKNNQHVHL